MGLKYEPASGPLHISVTSAPPVQHRVSRPNRWYQSQRHVRRPEPQSATQGDFFDKLIHKGVAVGHAAPRAPPSAPLSPAQEVTLSLLLDL